MDESKKPLMIGIIVICLALAASIFYWTHRRKSPAAFEETMYFLCTNPDCGKSFEMSAKEFQAAIQARGPAALPALRMPPIKCKFCGQDSAFLAEKCPKCGDVFLPNYDAEDGYRDRCPKCGYSQTEEIEKGLER